MAKRFIVTDVTRMQGNRVCVGGLLRTLGGLHPFPGGEHPTTGWLRQHRGRPLRPFSILDIELWEPFTNLVAPHWEDRNIDRTYAHLGELPPERRQSLLAQLSQPDLATLFGAPIHFAQPETTGWIQRGDGDRSLATLTIAEVLDVTSRDAESGQGLRITFRDVAGHRYRLPIADLSCCMYAEWLANQPELSWPTAVAQLSEELRRPAAIFLRIGAGRRWERYPDRCYLQVNGIYSFPDYLGGRCYADFIPPPPTVDVPF